MGKEGDHPTPVPNGNAAPFDLSNPDIHEVAGYVVSLSVDIKETKAEVQRIGRIADKVAQALGIEVDKSDPPPNYRAELTSHNEEIQALQRARAEEESAIASLRRRDEELSKANADTSQNIAAITADVAEAKAIVPLAKTVFERDWPKVLRYMGAIAAALAALTVLAQQSCQAARENKPAPPAQSASPPLAH